MRTSHEAGISFGAGRYSYPIGFLIFVFAGYFITLMLFDIPFVERDTSRLHLTLLGFLIQLMYYCIGYKYLLDDVNVELLILPWTELLFKLKIIVL